MREVEITNAVDVVGRACLPAEQMEQLRGFGFTQRTAFWCVAIDEPTANVVLTRVSCVTGVDTGVDDGGNGIVYAGELRAVGSERRHERGRYGQLGDGAGGVVQETRPRTELAVTGVEGGKMGAADLVRRGCRKGAEQR